MEQLQNRLLNQSEIIQTLKDQLNSYKDMEQERNNLRKEVGVLESRLKDLQKKLTRAENVARPVSHFVLSFGGVNGLDA